MRISDWSSDVCSSDLHLTPMIRGIHATLYATVADTSVDLQRLFEKRYANEPFVDVMPAGSHPETRSVRGANVCRIAVHRPQDGDLVGVLSVIDNLVNGASGQAGQNLNILFGRAETIGRASGRERVCTNVSRYWFAVSFKK